MKKFLLTTVWVLFALITITSCSNDDIIKKQASDDDGFKVETKVYVNDQEVSGTKAATEAGYTTGDGIYHRGDKPVVAAYANSGYELVRFYAKDGDLKYQGESSYVVEVVSDKYFKAEFKASLYSVNCAITGQGTVQIDGQPLMNGAKYPNGTYTLTAVPEPGWTQSWKTKQIEVDGADVNESVTFTEGPKYSVFVNVEPSTSAGDVWWKVRYLGNNRYELSTGLKDGVSESSYRFDGWRVQGNNITLSRDKVYIYTATKDVIFLAFWDR